MPDAERTYGGVADEDRHIGRNAVRNPEFDTSKMTPAECATFTGSMSYPVGQQKAEVEAREQQACQAADADYVNMFIRDLEDPDKTLVTEKPYDWTSYGAAGKAAILAVIREGRASIRARAKVVEPKCPKCCDRGYALGGGRSAGGVPKPYTRTMCDCEAAAKITEWLAGAAAANAKESHRSIPDNLGDPQFERGQTVWHRDSRERFAVLSSDSNFSWCIRIADDWRATIPNGLLSATDPSLAGDDNLTYEVKYPIVCCVEPGCDAVATCHYGQHPYCQTHFNAIPF